MGEGGGCHGGVCTGSFGPLVLEHREHEIAFAWENSIYIYRRQFMGNQLEHHPPKYNRTVLYMYPNGVQYIHDPHKK